MVESFLLRNVKIVITIIKNSLFVTTYNYMIQIINYAS